MPSTQTPSAIQNQPRPSGGVSMAAGIGKVTARRFAQEKCRVASWDVKDGEAEEGGCFQKVDVTNAAAVEAAVEEVVRREGFILVRFVTRNPRIGFSGSCHDDVLFDRAISRVLKVVTLTNGRAWR